MALLRPGMPKLPNLHLMPVTSDMQGISMEILHRR